MLKLCNVVLSRQLRMLKLQQAFGKIKGYMASNQLAVENKQLYLQYVEEVVRNKEQELITLEEGLETQLAQKNAVYRDQQILKPLQQAVEIDIIQKKLIKLKEVVDHLVTEQTGDTHEFKAFFDRKAANIEEECNEQLQQSQTVLKSEYQCLTQQRKQLRVEIAKYQELHAYQRYLNQFQVLLKNKQTELQEQYQNLNLNLNLSSTLNKELSFDRTYASGKKKSKKIFDSHYDNNRCTGQVQPHRADQEIDENTIMEEEDQHQFSELQTSRENHHHHHNHNHNHSQREELPLETLERLRKQKLMAKYVLLWLKKSMNGKGTLSHKRSMFIDIWRLNSLYDCGAIQFIQEVTEWPKTHINSLHQKQLIPYSKLSLRRQKYTQLLFDFEKKELHRKTIRLSLKHVIRNKNRKQRLAVVLIMKKFIHNCFLNVGKTFSKKTSKNMDKDISKTGLMENSSCKEDLSMMSSHVMHETRVREPSVWLQLRGKNSQKQLKDRTTKMHNHQHAESHPNLLSRSKNKKSRKENEIPPGLDTHKLKQYLKEHQQSERLLATQCAKIEALLHLQSTIGPPLQRNLNHFWNNFVMLNQGKRMQELERKVNCFYFKWDLFVTKCKLALTNNSNKLTHLQSLLSFMQCDQ